MDTRRTTQAKHEVRGVSGSVPETMRVWLLGGFQVSVGTRTIEDKEWRLRKAAALVKLLALAPNHRMHREQVMELLWPNLNPKAAANNLRHALHNARLTLGSGLAAATSRYLQLRGELLELSPEGPLWLDVEAFEEAAASARRAHSPSAYQVALNLYAGDLLPEDRYEEWAEERREELRSTYLALLAELAELYEERKEFGPAIEALRRLLRSEPSHEGAHVGLMRLYALSGERQAALMQYERLREALLRELGTDPAAISQRLYEDIVAGRVPPSRPEQVENRPTDGSGEGQREDPEGARRHNLPHALTSFVGREHELVAVKRALGMTRLLTLTGPGGSGKTRLALEVARDLAGAYSDGVWLVELAGLSEGELVPQEVMTTLGVREQPGRPLTETLVEALRNKEMLLVLDNCEHLIDACAQLAETLLSRCARLRVLATSREPLDVAGEMNWAVPALSLPDPQRTPTVEELEGYESARLFVERAQNRNPAFDLTPQDAEAVAEICQRLEGIPLAIELAAARVGLAVEQIAERLDDSLRLLTAGGRTATPRQQTLRGTLDWSYELLSEPERQLFGRLSVFAGGWALEAAEAVGAGDGIEKEDVLDLLLRLVDKSLVVVQTGAEGAPRYRMLEPVRQYAAQHLKNSGEANEAQSRHAAFFLALAEEAEKNTGGAQHALWLERLDREHDNFRAALSWALDWKKAQLGLRLSAALGGFWFIRGHFSEGHRWLTETLENSSATAEPERAKALVYSGWLAWERGDYEQSKGFSEEGLTLSRKLGDKVNTAAALYSLGVAAMLETEFERSSALLEEARSLQRALGDTIGLARTIAILGLVAMVQWDEIRAQALYEEGLPLAREANDGLATAYALCLGAGAALGREDHRRVKALCEEGLELSRQMDYKHALVLLLQQSAASAQAQEKPVRSARLWGAIEALRESFGATFSPVERHFYGPYIAAARAQLDEETWERAWAEGQAMTQEEAIEYALTEEEEPPAPSTVPVPDLPPTDKPSGGLTRREEEVAVLVGQGLTNRQIAQEMSVSERTVHSHIRKILKKLGLSSRTQIATWVADQQRIRPDSG